MYKIYLDETKDGVSIEEYLLNKEVFCVKTIADIDAGAIISVYSTVLVIAVECDEVRKDCHYIAIKFKDFTGNENEVKIYIYGGQYALSAFVKTTFYPVHQTFKRLSISGDV
jgi:hypothetical protein